MRAFLLLLTGVSFAVGQAPVSIEVTGTKLALATRPGIKALLNRSLMQAVSFAYEVDPVHIIAPQWLGQARYDFFIDAGDHPPEPLLREALEEKFSLNVNWETRPLETWILERIPGAELPTVAGPGDRGSLRYDYASGTLRGAANLALVALVLKTALKSEVLDETGTGGLFRFSLSWKPGDDDSLMRAFRAAGLNLHRDYRDSKVLVIYSAYWPDAPRPPRYACEAGSALKIAIQSLPVYDLSLPFDRRLAPGRKLLEEYPEDIFAEMAVQAMFIDRLELTSEWEWAMHHYAGMQDRVAAAFLEARLIMKTHPARAQSLLTNVLTREPDFARAHLLVAETAATRHPLEAALRRFRELCPESLADAPLYDRVDDKELLRAASEAFSQSLAKPIDETALAAYPHYWRIRRRLRQPAWPGNWLEIDLARVRALNLTKNPAWVAALEAGYELAGNRAALESLRRQLGANR